MLTTESSHQHCSKTQRVSETQTSDHQGADPQGGPRVQLIIASRCVITVVQTHSTQSYKTLRSLHRQLSGWVDVLGGWVGRWVVGGWEDRSWGKL